MAVSLLIVCLVGCGRDESSPRDASLEPSSGRPRGQWYDARGGNADDTETSQRARALEAIGYASGMEAATDVHGVLLNLAGQVAPGLSLYSSGHGPFAFLIESNGQIQKQWAVDATQIWPDRGYTFGYFRKVRLLESGVLLALFGGRGMAALGPDSEILWTYDEPAHHDVRELPDGTIYGLDRRARLIPEFHASRPLVDDRIYFLNPEGALLGRVSILQSLLDSPFADEVSQILREDIERNTQREEVLKELHADRLAADPSLIHKLDEVGDIFHCNSARVIGAEAAAAIPELEAGWYLVSIRQLSALVAIEVNERFDAGVARWWKRGAWRKQHEATALANGTILLFDNEGAGQSQSRVIEIDPTSGDTMWSYYGPPGVTFFSGVGGTCHRLPNGNTLVVESTAGTAYEIQRDGTCVWTFVSPHRAGENEELVAFLPDMVRIASN